MNRKYEAFASKEEFEKVITTAFHMSLPGPKENWSRSFDVYEWNTYLPILWKDLKIKFDFENCDFEYKNIGDFHFQLWWAGGDWQYSVGFIVYWDGDNIRAYIPKEGNCYNWQTKEALGEDEDKDVKFLEKLLKVKRMPHIYPSLRDFIEVHAEILYDEEAFIEDIKKRFGL